jgi:hypothetical protein
MSVARLQCTVSQIADVIGIADFSLPPADCADRESATKDRPLRGPTLSRLSHRNSKGQAWNAAQRVSVGWRLR